MPTINIGIQPEAAEFLDSYRKKYRWSYTRAILKIKEELEDAKYQVEVMRECFIGNKEQI